MVIPWGWVFLISEVPLYLGRSVNYVYLGSSASSSYVYLGRSNTYVYLGRSVPAGLVKTKDPTKTIWLLDSGAAGEPLCT